MIKIGVLAIPNTEALPINDAARAGLVDIDPGRRGLRYGHLAAGHDAALRIRQQRLCPQQRRHQNDRQATMQGGRTTQPVTQLPVHGSIPCRKIKENPGITIAVRSSIAQERLTKFNGAAQRLHHSESNAGTERAQLLPAIGIPRLIFPHFAIVCIDEKLGILNLRNFEFGRI
ncbi:MAG: hypothetical protein WCF85_19180, partial [Rhodospirillaceae bacterium]